MPIQKIFRAPARRANALPLCASKVRMGTALRSFNPSKRLSPTCVNQKIKGQHIGVASPKASAAPQKGLSSTTGHGAQVLRDTCHLRSSHKKKKKKRKKGATEQLRWGYNRHPVFARLWGDGQIPVAIFCADVLRPHPSLQVCADLNKDAVEKPELVCLDESVAPIGHWIPLS